MAMPIITVHKGDRHYLAHCIAQARASNPESEFILIGDRSNQYYRGVSHYNYLDYFSAAERFDKVFRHERSDYSRDCELFYFQRWLILNEFCEALNIEQFFVIDGDVMIYMDINELSRLYPNVKMTICRGEEGLARVPHGGSSFFFERSILQEYCDLIFECNQNIEHYTAIQNNEMWILGILFERNQGSIANCSEPVAGVMMQRNHSVSDGFEMERSGKRQKIHWRDGVPWARSLHSSKYIQLALLHCHGKNKTVMWRCVRPGRARVLFEWIANILSYKLLKYPKRWANSAMRKVLYPKL